MKSHIVTLLAVLSTILSVTAQEDGRRILRGKVLYRDANVPNENVINTTSGTATITNGEGEFAIAVKLGDQLAFTAVNYKIEVVVVDEALLARNRLVVEVREKVTALDEVVVTPENQERFLKVQNEEFKGFEYEADRGSRVENVAQAQEVRGMRDGLNFVNLFKALFKQRKKDGDGAVRKLKVSEVLRQVYDDEFFVVDLKLPRDKIDDFLIYCDDKVPSNDLLQKENEFQLIDFLVTHSKDYLDLLKEGEE